MDAQTKPVERVIGLDAHPDTFTAAILRGPTPAQAVEEKIFNRVPNTRLISWAEKHTTPADLIVLDASGNSFHLARSLIAIGRQALVLESCQMGKLKEAHANNDKISAIRIAKAYLAGTAKTVWIPDEKTQARRDLFHIHRKAVKRTTQLRNRLSSYLSDNGVRLKPGTELSEPGAAEIELRKKRDWSSMQWQIIEGLLQELRQADQMRNHWRSAIAHEVINDPLLLSIVRLCGIREVIAFALGAIIGDIRRFAEPRKLVKYVGLNPAFDDSGESKWRGGIGGHGRKDLRALLIEAAQSILRSKDPAARWGKRLLARKGSLALAVSAVARKLTVAVWYLMMGRWTELQELDRPLRSKLTKIISHARPEILGKTRTELRDTMAQSLQKGRVYFLDPTIKFTPAPANARRA
jgi:transposase